MYTGTVVMSLYDVYMEQTANQLHTVHVPVMACIHNKYDFASGGGSF